MRGGYKDGSLNKGETKDWEGRINMQTESIWLKSMNKLGLIDMLSEKEESIGEYIQQNIAKIFFIRAN